MKFKSEPKDMINDDRDDKVAQGDAVNRKGLRKSKRKSRRKESRK